MAEVQVSVSDENSVGWLTPIVTEVMVSELALVFDTLNVPPATLVAPVAPEQALGGVVLAAKCAGDAHHVARCRTWLAPACPAPPSYRDSPRQPPGTPRGLSPADQGHRPLPGGRE